jgi:hypothetical protein
MKTIALFLRLACLQCGFGQTDTNLIAVGDWSEAVSGGPDPAAQVLRGRLLVYDERSPSAANHARVYLELQHVFAFGWDNPMEVYFEFGDRNDLHFEMRDGSGQPVRPERHPVRGSLRNPFWVTLPCESTVRLRVDDLLGTLEKPDGLVILGFLMPPNATNDFSLSATFTPPKNHPSPLHYHVWQGTLKLPKVKIPAKKP